jgi:hypothetical protein
MSVWLHFKPGTDDYTNTATHIIGPVRGEQADLVIRQLEAAFISANFDVNVETVADD